MGSHFNFTFLDVLDVRYFDCIIGDPVQQLGAPVDELQFCSVRKSICPTMNRCFCVRGVGGASVLGTCWFICPEYQSIKRLVLAGTCWATACRCLQELLVYTAGLIDIYIRRPIRLRLCSPFSLGHVSFGRPEEGSNARPGYRQHQRWWQVPCFLSTAQWMNGRCG